MVVPGRRRVKVFIGDNDNDNDNDNTNMGCFLILRSASPFSHHLILSSVMLMMMMMIRTITAVESEYSFCEGSVGIKSIFDVYCTVL